MTGGPLARLPALASTGVGSLPFADPGKAITHLAGAYELPFCPQLPRREGDMIAEWLGEDPGRCGWLTDRDRERPAAWSALRTRLAQAPPAHRTVKLQVTGPATLAIALRRACPTHSLGRAETVALAREIAGWLAASVAAQVRTLRDSGLDAILLVDEPGLAAAGLAGADAGVWDALRAPPAAWGLHICGAVPWTLVDAAAPDLLSLDLTREPLPAAAHGPVRALLRRHGRVICGIVDPVTPGAPAAAADRLALATATLAALAPDGAGEELALTSPGCGTGRLSVAGERRVSAVLAAAVDLHRDRIGARR